MKEDVFERVEKIVSSISKKKDFKVIPKSEWEHKFVLFTGEDLENEIEKLLSKEQVLAYIKEDFYIILTEERFGISIIPLLNLAKRTKDASIQKLADWLLLRTLIALRLTRSKDGFERQLQAYLSGTIQIPEEKGFKIEKPKQKPEEEITYE